MSSERQRDDYSALGHTALKSSKRLPNTLLALSIIPRMSQIKTGGVRGMGLRKGGPTGTLWKAVVVLTQCGCTISCSRTFCSSLLPGTWGGLQSSLQAPPLALASSGQNRSGRCLFQTTTHSLSLLYLSWQSVLWRHHKMEEAGKAKPPRGGQLS